MMQDVTFKKKLNKICTVGSLVLLLLSQNGAFASIVFAQSIPQTATQSSQIHVGSASAVALPEDPTQQATFLGIIGLNTSPTASALPAKPTVVSALPKKSYRAQDQVEFSIGNSSKEGTKIQIIDSYGLDATDKFIIQKFASGSQTLVDIIPPQSRFKPGKYTLKITDSTGSSTTQDFTWGVLAIDTDKATYLPHETALISMAVLDELGNMVCDADVHLTIIDPTNHTTTLSTTNGQIIVNDICTKHEFSLTPDYQTIYTVGGAGTYQMNLSATKNGTYTISDTFTVANAVDFDVQRSTATRIFPPSWYPVTLHITANKDFSGVITDYVPATFDVRPATGSDAVSYTEVKTEYPGSEGVKDLFGVPALKLALPFTGTHGVDQGFGEQLTDPKEKEKYRFFHVLGHDGIDFVMPIGTAVLAADDGVVVRAAVNDDYGTTVVIRHSWGQSYYGHLSKMEVNVGEHVTKGQEIAKSGDTGLSSGSHLHFGIKPLHPQMDNGFFGKVDPVPFLPLNTEDRSVWDINMRLGNQPLKVVQWKVDLKKGDSVQLGYEFLAPRVSPEFYTLGPVHIIDNDGSVVLSEARVWQLAADAVLSTPVYYTNTASTKITSTTSWQLVTSAPASGNTVTSMTDASQRTAGFTQWLPGTTNSTKVGSAPTTPDGKGWIYDTPLDSTIPTGSWAFHATVNNGGTTVASGTLVVTVCMWKVTVAAGAITGSTQISTCTDGANNIYLSGTAQNLQVNMNSLAAQSFNANQYLYVEFWTHNSGNGSGGAKSVTTTFQVNAGVNNSINLPGSSSNLSPNAPTQNTPANNATSVSITPTFTMTATDPESDNEQYKVTVYANSLCSSVIQTNDQSSSQTGWSGQNATCSVANDCYTSGTTASFVAQSGLTAGTQYWWKASAKDPTGSNTFTDSSTCNTFTTAVSGPTLDQLLKHGEWFSNGVEQPFTF